MLSLFAESSSLEYEGGAANVGMPRCSGNVHIALTDGTSGMLMDWRQMSGRPTTGASLADTWQTLNSVWSGGKQVGTEDWEAGHWDGKLDYRRGWIIAVCWMAACGAEYVRLL